MQHLATPQALACPATLGGVDGGPLAPTVVAVIPAHNEGAGITATLAGLRAQTHAVDRIIVVADNCTDDTEQVAAAAGAEVFATTGNEDRKAGALNQALDVLLPTLRASDCVMAV
ncbi:MAG: glycosyltransferase, partial [Nocardioidaceae bacterium]